MELPILLKYDQIFDSNCKEIIRILDIDGAYLVSITILESITHVFIEHKEIAFDSIWEAENYLKYDLGIDFPEDKLTEQEWLGHDY